MRFLYALILALAIAAPAVAAPKTKVGHSTYLGGELHEACTSGVCDGIVFWKNGTAQAVHNRKRGKWFPANFASEKDPVIPGDAGPRRYKSVVPTIQRPAPVLSLGRTTETNAYMTNFMTGSMVLRAGTAIIDDYILITPQQVTAWGGFTAAMNQAHLAVDIMNDSLLHAGVDAQTNIVGIAQYDLNETTWDADLTVIANRVLQGYYNTVRATTGFDTISLLTTRGEYCGQAYVYYSSIPLAMVNGGCAAANRSYAHEKGHTLGLMHNAGDTGYAAVCGPTAVGYGESRFRTPMSYAGGPRTSQYSAPPPAVWYVDGISPVGTSQTNAAACLRITAPIVAAWHASMGTPLPPPPEPPTAPRLVSWTRTGAPGATVAGDLTWTHTRTVALAKYQHTVDGGGAVDDGLPATNIKSITLSSGTRTVILSACYSDLTCLAASPLTVVVPAATTPISVSGLSPVDGSHFAKGSTVTFSVTATDDSGITSVVGYYSNKSSYQAKTTTRSNNTYSFQVRRPSGTRRWYFVIQATDGETVQTTTRSIVVP